MQTDILLGIAIGGLLSGINGVISYKLLMRALTRTGTDFMMLVLGGMGMRLLVLMLAVMIVVWLIPVNIIAFMASLLGVFVLGLIIDLFVVIRRSRAV